MHAGQDSQEEKVAFLQLCSLMMQKKGSPSNGLAYIYEEFQVYCLSLFAGKVHILTSVLTVVDVR